MTPESLAKEIAQKVATSLEVTLTAALTAAQKEWAAEADKALEKMRDWVRSAPIAVSVPVGLIEEEAKPKSTPEPETDSRGYAARGAVPKTIADTLQAHPGIKTAEIMKKVRQANSTISIKSIANELSRGKFKKRYRRENDGRWFNM